MWNHKLSLLLFILMLFFSGCSKSVKTPVSAGYDAKQFVSPEGKGVVYLYRGVKALLPEEQFVVRINDREVGKSGPGTYFRWELKPGTYSISSSAKESSDVVKIEVAAGRFYFFKQIVRMGLAKGGRIFIEEMDMAEAKKEIGGLKQLTSPDIKR